MEPTGGKPAPNLPSSLTQNTETPYLRPNTLSGQADRKERCWSCGLGRSEEAKVAL
jgi:hypothetical protein